MMAREQVRLTVRQEPKRAQVVQENNPKNRKPIDPPPIIELKYDDENDPSNAQWLVSPRTFMMVTLISTKEEQEQAPGKLLIGQTVSSLHRLKDINNKDGGFFVFGDISAKRCGQFKLRFSLFDTNKDTEEVVFLASAESAIFPVVPQRDFGSMSESTHLTRTFSDQGVKLRVRKDTRSITGVKRTYNGSPPDTTPSSVPSNGPGTEPDYSYSTSGPHPSVKRQRSSSSYDSTVYQNPALADTPSSSYNSTLPSSTRYSNDYQRNYAAYPGYSPGSLSVSSRIAPLQSNGWPGSQQTNSLPSPTTGVSGQQQQISYSTVGASQQFGDPGTSSIPRNSYPSAYYDQPSYYQGTTSPDNNPYSLSMPGGAIPDGSSSQSHPYGTGYLPSNSFYGNETSDAPDPYPAFTHTRSGAA